MSISFCIDSNGPVHSGYPLPCTLIMQHPAQVAERSLFLWNNEYIVSLVAQHRHAVLPLVFPALERNARSHWNPAVHGLTVNVRVPSGLPIPASFCSLTRTQFFVAGTLGTGSTVRLPNERHEPQL